MKKLILLILFFTLCCPGTVFPIDNKKAEPLKNNVIDIEKYRIYPFQWVLPEYYYKADIVPVKKEKLPPKGYSRIEFFGLSACIPELYTPEIPKMNHIRSFKSKAGDRILIIKSPDSSMLCSEETYRYQKDYCSSFKSVQELYDKQYTLTPDVLNKTAGDMWIIHGKGVAFENFKKIQIYSDDKFMAYVGFTKDALVKETKYSHTITLFHANGPLNCYVTISFLANDDTLLNHFISTIE